MLATKEKPASAARLGVVVRDLGASELNWRLLRQSRVAEVTYFFDNLLPCCLPVQAACMRLTDAWSYRWPLVATNLDTARKVARFASPSVKLFYVWDLEWLRLGRRPFRALREVYVNSRLKLVARTEEHRQLLEDLWGARVAGVVPDASLTSLLALAQS